MKRLLTYLFIILNFGLVIKASANEIKFKQIQINTNEVYKKFGRDLIGVIEDAVSYHNRFYEHTEDNNLKGIIEIFSMDTSAYEGQINTWFRSIAVKSNSKVGCNKSDKSIFFESIDLGNNLACLSIREINKDELSSPNFNKNKHIKFSSRKSNIEKLIKKKQLSVSDRMIRAEHYFYKSGRIRWVFYTKAIDLNSENEVNDFINETFQNHKNFGEQLKIKKTTQLALKDVKIDKTLVVEKKVVDQTPKLVLDNDINEKKIVKKVSKITKDKIDTKSSKKLESSNRDKVLTNILYEKILENKYILKSKYIKKFDSELKYISGKIKADGYSSGPDYTKRIKSMVLAVYINDADVNKIYKDPLINIDLGKLAYGWEASKLMYREVSYEEKEKSSNWGSKKASINSFGVKAIEDCRKISKKMRLNGGKCYFVDFRQFHGGHSKFNPPGTSNLLFSEKGKLLIENDTLIADIKIINIIENTNQKNEIVKNIDEDKKNDEKIIKSASNEKKLKKKVKSSEVNFYKIKQGDYIDNPIVSISKNNKIALPKGIWQVAKKSRISVWAPTENIILINQSREDSPSFGEFIEIAVTKPAQSKHYPKVLVELKKPCSKKYYFHDILKTSGPGNTYSCFVSGFVENDIFKIPTSNFNPWNYKFRDYFLKKGTLTDNILFSLSAYGSRSLNSKIITVVYGSSLNSIGDKNKIDFKNEELIKNIWTKKTIDFHNNFQNNMNFKESLMVNLDAEYQDLENKYADLSTTADQKQKVKKIIKKEKKAKKKLVVDKEISEEQKKIADKKAKAEKKKKLAKKKIEEEEKKLVEKKAKEEAENQKILSSTNIDTEITNDENSADNKNFLKALAKKEVLEYNKKKIIRYECQQPWDLTTEDYRPLIDIYELDLEDRVLVGTHRYITDKEYTEERTYPILAEDKNRVLVRYDSPNGNFTTKFFFNYGTDQSIVAADNSYKTQAKCVNRDYFVDIKVAKKKVDNLELSKKDLKALEEAKNEALLAEKEIKEIEKEQEKLLAKQEKILQKQKQNTETTNVAKLKIYEDPKKLSKSFSSSISKSKFKKYNATSTVSYLFFESSENYLISLELLYRAYDLNTEAEKIRSHLSYMKESKSSENQRLKSTRQIVQNQTVKISNNIKNESVVLTEQGRVYYAQSLPYALNAAIATYNLYHVAINTVNNVGNDGDIVFGILNNLNNVIGIAQILPQIPSYSKNMYQTTKLIITGAKTKKIKESTSTKKALDELNLEI